MKLKKKEKVIAKFTIWYEGNSKSCIYNNSNCCNWNDLELEILPTDTNWPNISKLAQSNSRMYTCIQKALWIIPFSPKADFVGCNPN